MGKRFLLLVNERVTMVKKVKEVKEVKQVK
jgi:hypothetical protein